LVKQEEKKQGISI